MSAQLRPVFPRALAAVAGAILLLFTALPARADGDASEDIVRDVAIEITIDSDGLAHVSETYQWDFGERNGLGFYRELTQHMGWEDDPSLMRQYVYSDFAVTSPSGAPAEVWVESDYGDTIQLAIGAPDGSDDTRTGVQTYVLTYTIEGALNAVRDQDGVSDQDEFYWNVLSGSTNPIEHVSVAVTGPSDVVDVACYEGDYGSTDPCSGYSSDAATASFESDGLEVSQSLSVMAAWAPGTFTDIEPILVANEYADSDDSTWDQEPTFVQRNFGWLAGVVGALAGGLVFLQWRRGRDLHFVGIPPNQLPRAAEAQALRVEPLKSQPPVTVQFTPPAGLRPVEGGVLLEESANPAHITATIVDLAVRGYLTIEESGTSIFGKPNDWTLTRTAKQIEDNTLRTYELGLLGALFASGRDVKISDLRGDFASKVASYKSQLTEVSNQAEWFTRPGLVSSLGSSNAARTVFIAVFGMVWLVAASAGMFALIVSGNSPWMVFAAGSVVVLMVVWLATRKLGHARSATGRALYEQTRGFKQYLETAEANQLKWEQGQDIFSEYLPWAMVFGCADRWSELFETLALEGRYTVQPTWYLTPGGFHPGYFHAMGSSMNRFASQGATSLNYTPGSSGGSGSFGGGGGFSGGGGGGGGVGGR